MRNALLHAPRLPAAADGRLSGVRDDKPLTGRLVVDVSYPLDGRVHDEAGLLEAACKIPDSVAVEGGWKSGSMGVVSAQA